MCGGSWGAGQLQGNSAEGFAEDRFTHRVGRRVAFGSAVAHGSGLSCARGARNGPLRSGYLIQSAHVMLRMGDRDQP